MNQRIGRLFSLTCAGVAVLVTMTAYWQIWAAPSLAVRQDNARLVYRQLTVKRGLIYAGNSQTVLATNVRKVRNGQTLYLRRYPLRGLFAHPVGYNTVGSGRTGLELSYNDYLTASNDDLSTLFDTLGDRITGRTITGNNLHHVALGARPAGGRQRGSAGCGAPWSRSTRTPARCWPWRRRRPSTRTPSPATSTGCRRRAPARRCSTGPPRGCTRRARRSRS